MASFETSFFGIKCELAYGEHVLLESFGGLTVESDINQLHVRDVTSSSTVPDDCPLHMRGRKVIDPSHFSVCFGCSEGAPDLVEFILEL